MHFSANVEESPLQTDAETGGEPGQDLLGRKPGGSQHCCASARRWRGNTCPVNDGWSRFPLLSVGLVQCLRRILVALSLARMGTHVSPGSAPARCVPMCTNAAGRLGPERRR